MKEFEEIKTISTIIKDTGDIQKTLADKLAIIGDDNIGLANDTLRALKVYVKQVDTERLEMTRPIDEAKKGIMFKASKITAPLKAAITILNTRVLEYQIAKDEAEKERQRLAREQEVMRLKAEQAEIEEQAVDNQSDLAIQDAIAIEEKIEAVEISEVVGQTQSKGDFSSSSLVEVWKCEVIDFELLPDEYKIANQVVLDKIVKGKTGLRTIPGCKIFAKRELRTRGR